MKERERKRKEGDWLLGLDCLICFLCWGLLAHKQKSSWERQRRPDRHSYKPPDRHIPAQYDHFLWKKNPGTLANHSVPSHTSEQVFPEMCFEVGHHQLYQQNKCPPVHRRDLNFCLFIYFNNILFYFNFVLFYFIFEYNTTEKFWVK